MKSERERPIGKIRYEKPTAVDLGPTAPMVGASCGDGGQFEIGFDCNEVGNAAQQGCEAVGNGAVLGCTTGDDYWIGA